MKKGQKMSPAARAKIAAAKRGKKQSPEHAAARAAALKGNTNAAGHRVTPKQKANLKQARRKTPGA